MSIENNDLARATQELAAVMRKFGVPRWRQKLWAAEYRVGLFVRRIVRWSR